MLKSDVFMENEELIRDIRHCVVRMEHEKRKEIEEAYKAHHKRVCQVLFSATETVNRVKRDLSQATLRMD